MKQKKQTKLKSTKKFNKIKVNFTTSERKLASLFRQFHVIVRWLSVGFVNQHPTNLLFELKVLTDKFAALNIKCGALYTIKYIKECRRALSQYLSSTKTTSLFVRLTYDGLPAVLGNLIPVIRGTDGVATLRFLYTALTCTRSLRLGTKPDTKPITEPSRSLIGTLDFISSSGKYLRSFWSELGYLPSKKIPKPVLWRKYHLTSKSGPTGHALKFCLHELSILPYNLIDDITYCGGDKLSTAIHELKSIPNELRSELTSKSSKKCYRKITHFSDKEDKVRIIAILDYWSQTVLKPLHDYLNNVLKRIPQDCTFDQAGFYSRIKDSTVFYSVDLTAATDRFPIEVIKTVLKGKFPTLYVEAWARIMVGHPFDFQGKTISYTVGNPMGAYSSWASFAVAHHFVVYSCIRDLGLKWKQVPYCLLGDDIVIGHKEVAELYILRIKSLGVEISESKTHISPHFCEFAKRLIYKGQEITPFPYGSIKETSRRSFLLTGLLLDTVKKGWIPKDSAPSCVGLFYELVKKYNSRRRKVLIETAQFTELVMTMTKDSASPKEIFHDFVGKYCRPTQTDYTIEESFTFFRNVIWRVACKSMEELHFKGMDGDNESFGSLYDFQVNTVNSYIDRDLLSIDFHFSSLPVYQLTEEITECIGRFSREISDRMAVRGSIKNLLKVISLPTDDRIFSQRSYYRSLSTAAYICKLLKPSLDRVRKSGIVVTREKRNTQSMSSSELLASLKLKGLPKF